MNSIADLLEKNSLKGEELGIKARAVSYHLRTLCAKGYIERIRQGVYRKVVKRVNCKNRLAA